MTPMDFLERFKSVKKSGAGWVCRCPAHDDGQNSLSIKRADDKWLLRCHVGCGVEEITAAIGIKVSDLFDKPMGAKRKRKGPQSDPSDNQTTDQPKQESCGLTLADYAAETPDRIPEGMRSLRYGP